MRKFCVFSVVCCVLLLFGLGCETSTLEDSNPNTSATVEEALDLQTLYSTYSDLFPGESFPETTAIDFGPDRSVTKLGDLRLEIISPAHKLRVGKSETIAFVGSVRVSNEPVDDQEVAWVSDLDGLLGSGRELPVENLSVGLHKITLRCNGAEASIEMAVFDKNWTIMVYMDGDNNLEGNGIEDLNEMEAIGSDDNINVIVAFDRIPGYNSSNGNWTDTRLFYVTKDNNTSIINSTLLRTPGEMKMDRASTLAIWGWWGIANYPAAHYALVIWDHGTGWTKGEEKPVRGSCSDDTSGWNSELEIWEVRLAMGAFLGFHGLDRLDLLGYDCCLMGMAEVGYETADMVDTFVASEETEGLDGWEYDRWLGSLKSDPTADSATLGEFIVDAYTGWGYETLSAVDTSKSGEFIDAFNAFCEELIDSLPGSFFKIQSARGSTKKFDDRSYIDLGDFTAKIKSQNISGDVNDAANDLQSAMADYIIANGGSATNAYGISIWFPASYNASNMSSYKNNIQWSGATEWDEFLEAYF